MERSKEDIIILSKHFSMGKRLNILTSWDALSLSRDTSLTASLLNKPIGMVVVGAYLSTQLIKGPPVTWEVWLAGVQAFILVGCSHIAHKVAIDLT